MFQQVAQKIIRAFKLPSARYASLFIISPMSELILIKIMLGDVNLHNNLKSVLLEFHRYFEEPKSRGSYFHSQRSSPRLIRAEEPVLFNPVMSSVTWKWKWNKFTK
jgi:hypothetical protein